MTAPPSAACASATAPTPATFPPSHFTPKRGTCRFDLAQFRQTQALPSVELTGARDCRVHMWEQGEQITVAFANCHHLCSPASAQDYVWPLLIDKATGQCD